MRAFRSTNRSFVFLTGFTLLIATLGNIVPAQTTLALSRASSAQAQAANLRPIGYEVPLSLRRKAAQQLEDLRFSNLAAGWEKAQIGEPVRPLYRPDVADVAYYEFPVTVDGRPAGFITLSTEGHDFPVAHWNSEGETPTQQLEAQVATDEQLTFYKLDALTYVAENTRGELVASTDSRLIKVSGTSYAALDGSHELSETTWQPAPSSSDSSITPRSSGSLVTSGPQSSSLRLDEWASWADLKSGYRQSYGVLAESLRRNASTDWAIDREVAESGEGLVEGSTYSLALLSMDIPEISISGDGAPYVQTELVKREGLSPLFNITAIGSKADVGLPLDVDIRYTDGQSEVVKFFVVPAPVTTQAAGQPSLMSAWSPWTYYWAGTDSDQRLYNQIAAHTGPNTSGCWSGCGATSWAMLFGWADYQASIGNGAWAGRWGIYRQNGGYGADAVAPKYMDTGIQNISWELRNRIGTFCAFGSGATAPWDMGQASGYLSGRSGIGLTTHYNVFGFSEDRLRDYAINSIKYRRTPAIIGTGWLSHYPLAYGYAQQSRVVRKCFLWHCWDEVEYNRWFYVNQGWGGSGNGWVPASTWFAGEINP